MPLRGLKHSVPYSGQAQSVYGMIKFLLKNSAGSADNVFCISSFSDLRQAKKAVLRLPRGKRALCHSIKQLHSRHPDVISVWGSSLWGIIWICFSPPAFIYFLAYLLTYSVLFGECFPNKQRFQRGTQRAKQMGRLAWSGHGRGNGTSAPRARWMLGSVGPWPTAASAAEMLRGQSLCCIPRSSEPSGNLGELTCTCKSPCPTFKALQPHNTDDSHWREHSESHLL